MAHPHNGGSSRRQFDPLGDVERTQELTRKGIVASGELLKPEILARIGDALGGLNAIGGLRSGGAEVALQDISREFTDRFGNIATAATTGAVGAGLQAGGLRLQDADLRFREKEARKKRKAALLGAIGSVVGAGVGFVVAGPPGAAAGSQVL